MGAGFEIVFTCLLLTRKQTQMQTYLIVRAAFLLPIDLLRQTNTLDSRD
jgi:hypothetical protein